MKETREMMKILEENKKKAQKREQEKRLQEQQRKAEEREQKKTAMILVLTLIILVLAIALLKNMMDRDYNKCIESGKTETYCERYLSIDK